MGLNWEQEPDLASRDPNGLNNHITSVSKIKLNLNIIINILFALTLK